MASDPVWSKITPTIETIVREYPADEVGIREYLEAAFSKEHTFPGVFGTTAGAHLPGRCGVLFVGTAAQIAALSSPPQYAEAYATDTCLPYYFDGANWQGMDLVTKSTTQTISGAKTFTGNAVFSGNTINISATGTFAKPVEFQDVVTFAVQPDMTIDIVNDLTPQLGGNLDGNDKTISKVKSFDYSDFAEVTIDSGGALAVTQACHTVDTYADAATDNLDTITGMTNGMVLYLRPENDARTVVIKHNTGNIWIPAGVDISLNDIRDAVHLIYDGTKVLVVGHVGVALLNDAIAGDYVEARSDAQSAASSFGGTHTVRKQFIAGKAGTYRIVYTTGSFSDETAVLTQDISGWSAGDLIQIGNRHGSNYSYSSVLRNGVAVGTEDIQTLGGAYISKVRICSGNPLLSCVDINYLDAWHVVGSG